MLSMITPILPPAIRNAVIAMPAETQSAAEELRIREGRPLEVIYRGAYSFVSPGGSLGIPASEAYIPTREDCARLLEMLTNHSVYSFEEELKRGFITMEGGHRVGLAGRTVLESGCVRQIRDVSGFNIRIAREVRDCARPVLPLVMDPAGRTVHHTLIVSPPQHGKTTMIRDLARLISWGYWPAARNACGGLKVGIVDERSEIAACVKGVPRFDVGPRTDVMDGCPKAEGMMMMVRSMSPDVIVADEIGRPEDARAVHEAVHAGIRVMATAHGSGFQDVLRRPALRQLAEEGVFGRIVVLRKRGGSVAVEEVYDGAGKKTDCFGRERLEQSHKG